MDIIRRPKSTSRGKRKNFEPPFRPDNSRRKEPFKKSKKSRFFYLGIFFLTAFALAFSVAAFMAFRFYETSKKVMSEQARPKSFVDSLSQITKKEYPALKGEEDGRINVLLLGLAGENYPGENLTDSIIVVSIDTKANRVAFFSIPRDLYVRIPETTLFTKINAIYAYGIGKNGKATEGIEKLKQVLNEITGLEIHYFVAIDFDGFKKLIDDLGGITVDVKNDIYDDRYPGPNYSYQTFELSKGIQQMDGETALKYSRTRHDAEGDFGRSFRQQQVLTAARQKAFSLKNILEIENINNLLNTLGDHVRTDISIAEIKSFLSLAEIINFQNPINLVLNSGKPESLLKASHVILGRVRAFILIPRTGTYEEIKEMSRDIFDLALRERKKAAIAKENATLGIIGSKDKKTAENLAKICQSMGYEAKAIGFSTSKAISLNQEQTSVIYDIAQGKKPFSLEDISKKLKLTVSVEFPQDIKDACAEFDFCLLASSDADEIFDIEEISNEELEEGYDKQSVDEKTYIEYLKLGTERKLTR